MAEMIKTEGCFEHSSSNSETINSGGLPIASTNALVSPIGVLVNGDWGVDKPARRRIKQGAAI
jgi:hypothetical protein